MKTTKRATKQDLPIIVDELGDLETQLAAEKLKYELRIKERQERFDALHEQLLSAVSNVPASETVLVQGTRYWAQVSEQANRRTFRSMVDLFAKLGKVTFLKNCDFKLAKADAILTPEERAELISTERTGPRRINLVAKFLEKAA